MKRCAVFGAKGYLGRHLVYYLNKLGHDVIAYDVFISQENRYKQIDVTNREAMMSVDLDVDYIFMFAGITGTYNGFDAYEKYLIGNEFGLLNLLDSIKNSPYNPKVIFPSTRLVYRGADKPLHELDEKDSKTIYAVNKMACEGYLKAYHDSFDIPYSVFRICIPYGNLLTSDYSFGTIGFFIKQAIEGKKITLYGGGVNKRTFTHIEDLCCQVVKGAFHPNSNGEIYNVGGETLSLHDAATIIAERFGVEVEAVPWPCRDSRIESGHTYFDDSKIQSLIGRMSYKLLEDFSNDI